MVISEPITGRAGLWHRIPEFGMGLLTIKVKRKERKRMKGEEKKIHLLVLRIPEMI